MIINLFHKYMYAVLLLWSNDDNLFICVDGIHLNLHCFCTFIELLLVRVCICCDAAGLHFSAVKPIYIAQSASCC